MKQLKINQLKKHFRKINKKRQLVKKAIEARNENLKGIEAQVNAVNKESKSAGRHARQQLTELLNKQRKQNYNETTDSLKSLSHKTLMTPSRLNRLYHNLQRQQVDISEESIKPEYDSQGVKNIVTLSAVKSLPKKYHVKINKKASLVQRQKYLADFSHTPEKLKKEARNALRRSRRKISGKHIDSINKVMGLIKKTYFGNAQIQDSNQVFDTVIGVMKDQDYELDGSNIDKLIDKIMEESENNEE